MILNVSHDLPVAAVASSGWLTKLPFTGEPMGFVSGALLPCRFQFCEQHHCHEKGERQLIEPTVVDVTV